MIGANRDNGYYCSRSKNKKPLLGGLAVGGWRCLLIGKLRWQRRQRSQSSSAFTELVVHDNVVASFPHLRAQSREVHLGIQWLSLDVSNCITSTRGAHLPWSCNGAPRRILARRGCHLGQEDPRSARKCRRESFSRAAFGWR